MKNYYNMQKFNEMYIKIQDFVDREGLDPNQCTIDFVDGADDDMHVMCHDNVSQRHFGLGLKKDHIAKPNYKWLDNSDTMHQNN